MTEKSFKPEKTVRKALDTEGIRFDIGIYEYLNEKIPEDIETMSALAEAYTRSGRLDAGLQIDLKLIELDPNNPIVHYNLACSYSLLNRAEESLDQLEIAIQLGYCDAGHLDEDPDFANVKSSPRFRSLLALIRN